MAVVRACGFECGIVAAGAGASTLPLHWGAQGGTPTMSTSTVRSGARSALFSATGAFLQRTAAASQTVMYFRGYFLLPDATPTGDIRLIQYDQTAGLDVRVVLRTTGILEVSYAGSAIVTGPTLSDSVWYGIEMEVNISADPNVIKWRTWNGATGIWTDRTDAPLAQAASTFVAASALRFGQPTGITASVFFDDIIIGEGTTPGEDYKSLPRGGQILRLLTSADVSPHPFTTNDFADGAAGAGFANSATDMWNRLDDSDQTSIADGFIRQAVAWASGTKAFHVAFADASTAINLGVVAVTMTFHSDGTGANEVNVRVSDDLATWTNVLGDWAGVGSDVSDTTASYRQVVLPAKPSGGAWSVAALNTMTAQMGQSNDIAAIPYYDSISLEYEALEALTGAMAMTTGTIS